MHLSLFVLFACAFVLAQAGTWRQSQDSSTSVEDSNPSWTHRHADYWPCDVADYPEAYLLIHKVEKRLENIDDEQLKRNIVNFVVSELRLCKTTNGMDEPCVKRSIGYAMSFISRHMPGQ